MVYSDNTGVLLYCKPYQLFYIHRAHHAWFGEYNYSVSYGYQHTLRSIQLQQYPEGFPWHNSNQMNLVL